MIQRQAHSLLDHKDLNFVQFSRCPNFYYERAQSSSEHMRGEQYTCDKCGQIYFARYTAAASVALFDLNLSYDDNDRRIGSIG